MITRERAFTLIREIEPLADQAGYLLGLYGSLLHAAEGNDVDLLAEPKRETAPEALIARLTGRGWVVLAEYSGLLGDAATLERAGELLDIRFGRTVWKELRYL